MRFAIFIPFFMLLGCLDGPSFMNKSSQSSLQTRGGAGTRVVATEEAGGIVTAAIDPSSTLTQVVTASNESDIAGTSISFPPGSVGIATSLSVESGADLTGIAFESEVGLSAGSLAAASKAVVIDTSVAMNAAQPFTVSIALPSSLQLVQSNQMLVVLFRYKDAETGKIYSGVIPTSEISIINGFAYFKTLHFGAFQLAYTEKVIEAPVRVETVKEIIKARDVPAVASTVKWSQIAASYDVPTKIVKASATPEGMNQIESCYLVVDADKQRPWDQVSKSSPNANEALTLVWSGPSAQVHARIECANTAGVVFTSDWSSAIQIAVSAGMKISSPIIILDYEQVVTVNVTGGVPPYSFAVEDARGAITSAGVYTAPRLAGSATVLAKDTRGQTVKLVLTIKAPSTPPVTPPSVTPGLALYPANPEVSYGGTIQFTATGGKPPYVFSVSGYGTISSDGLYASSGMGTSDVVSVTDANGVVMSKTVQIYYSAYLRTRKARVDTVTPIEALGGKPPLSFVVDGGSGAGSFSFPNIFNAPSTPQITPIKIMDALGQITTEVIEVLGSGDRDPSFSQSDWDYGYVSMVSPIVSNRNYMRALAVDANGRFIMAGMAFSCCSPQKKYIAVSRLLSDGSPDPSFGTGGGVTIAYPLGSDGQAFAHANAVAIHPSGDIYVAGKSQNLGWIVMRLNQVGALQAQFGGTGVFVEEFAANTGVTDEAFDVKIASDGDVLVAGVGNGKPVVIKLDKTTGVIKSNFGSGGKFVDSEVGVVRSMGLTSDGVVLCGKFGGWFKVKKINSAGVGMDFDVNQSEISPAIEGECRSVAIAPVTNDIIVAGYQEQSSTAFDWVVAKYNSSGTAVSAFNSGSPLILSHSTGTDIAEAVYIDGDDIYVAGSVEENISTSGHGHLMRIDADGLASVGFYGDGTTYRRLASTSTAANKFYDIAVVKGALPRIYVVDTMNEVSDAGSLLIGIIP